MSSQEPQKPSAERAQEGAFQRVLNEAMRQYSEDVRQALNSRWVFGSYMPPSRTRWQKLVSKVAMRRNIVRERVALRIAPWLEPDEDY